MTEPIPRYQIEMKDMLISFENEEAMIHFIQHELRGQKYEIRTLH